MAFSPGPKDAQVSISVFGGLCTQPSPISLPEGASPDNQELVYFPGGLSSRPGFQCVLSPRLTGNPRYGKSYACPNGKTYNLFLDDAGRLYYEDISVAGIAAITSALDTGLYAKSVTAFGKEFIALSDALHGADTPLQWDGTNLDRVTQDGPGAAPAVASVALAVCAMAAAAPGSDVVLALNEADPAGQLPDGSYSRINFWTNSDTSTLSEGKRVTIAGYAGGSAAMNGTWPILQIFPANGHPFGDLVILQASLPAGTDWSTAAGATGTVSSIGVTMARANNVVTVRTQDPHHMQVGYQAQISGVPASVVGGTDAPGIQIEVSNEDAPGIATVATPENHGLSPGCYVSISEVQGTEVGGGITDAFRAGGIVTIKTTDNHGLTPGSVVTIAGTGSAAINTTMVVANIPDPKSFTFVEPGAASDIAPLGAGGTVKLNWPITNSGAPTYFEVLAAPGPKVFQIALNYANGTWTTGVVKYEWGGKFFVSAVPDANTIQYQQYGPDSVTDAVGTVTPYGQIAPGIHQCQVHFLTRNGYLTRPSPPVKFMATGGQYVSVSNIPIGPANVVARVLAFTGSAGAYFFYIPVAAQVNGQVVSTATQIDDNTTTEILLDFSDLTLYSATGVSIPGNNAAAQVILDGCLGFGFYGSRLLAWGMRNRVQSLLNMGFEGGALPDNDTQPAGWSVSGAVGALAAGHVVGKAYSFSGAGNISQPACRDAYGAPIVQPNTKYRFRCWSQGLATITASLEGTGFAALAVINSTAAAGWHEAVFSLKTPVSIPPDLVLKITVDAAVKIDELSVIYDERPYLDTLIWASYADNPEAFDGITGKFGSNKDPHKILDVADIRQTGYFLTQEPSGRLHQFSDNGVTEPAGWGVGQVAANCGLLSAFALTKSQGDDSSSSGGEEWFAWASLSGARIFSGSEPHKISEEIQPDWDRINRLAHKTVWCFNDPVDRVLYFGLPLDAATAPSRVYPMNYKGLDSAEQIAAANPILPGFGGRSGTLDRARKWTRWLRAFNGAGLLYRGVNKIQPVFLSGPNYGQAYIFNTCYDEDDDYGAFSPCYVTFFCPTPDLEQALGLGTDRKTVVYFTAAVEGRGFVTVTLYPNALDNPWPLTVKRALKTNPKFDMEWSGANCVGQRIAAKLTWSAT